MFTAALFITVTIGKLLKCPSTNERINKMLMHACAGAHAHTHTHTMQYYSAIKKSETLPPATTWMHVEGIIFSEVNQRKKHCRISFTYQI